MQKNPWHEGSSWSSIPHFPAFSRTVTTLCSPRSSSEGASVSSPTQTGVGNHTPPGKPRVLVTPPAIKSHPIEWKATILPEIRTPPASAAARAEDCQLLSSFTSSGCQNQNAYNPMGENAEEEPRLVICIGDIHGHFSKLQNLWANLQSSISPPSFQSAVVIFLGDYCDRGADSRAVLDFLISLPARYPRQSHVFLCGNHDFAFAAFIGALPPPPDGSPFSATWEEYLAGEEREGWFKGDGYEQMHVQGRRWGGKIKVKYNEKKKMEYKGSIYDASPTFESYGVPHGSAGVGFFFVRLLWFRFE